ncbi:hypothetical protein TWF225_008039 [Orbilia oligospora]|nr:hypothetical protein TWF225_008039 [Orbilia oligospora]KAF3239834.1 hypothetical protein TWF217_001158 [Orbilia oligospora]KAF3260096.1 hypothetical protein TWF128_003577 [Orbilia oligospora]KAF3280311.1 hypothetical protein TWF132_011869 [Orbilia oligospora]
MPWSKYSQITVVPGTDSEDYDLDDIKYLAPKRQEKEKTFKTEKGVEMKGSSKLEHAIEAALDSGETESGNDTSDLDNIKSTSSKKKSNPRPKIAPKKDPSVIDLLSSPEPIAKKPVLPTKKQRPLSTSTPRKKRKPSSPVQPSSSSSEDDFRPFPRKRAREGVAFPTGARVRVERGREKVVMTDDEDDDPYQRYKASKKRKPGTRGRPRKDSAITPRKPYASSSTPRPRRTNTQLRDLAIDRENGFKSDEDTTLDCPLHLLLKKQTLEKDQKEKFKPLESIYRFPPDSNIFSDDEDVLEDLEEKPQFPGASPCRAYEDIVLERSRGVIPASIARWLRDYQIEGVRFMHNAFILNTGVILGDDMGLGKTVQVIAFLTAAFGKTGDARDSRRMRRMRDRRPDEWYPKVLIVCPGTLISNWIRELETWGWWQVYAYHGAKGAKEDALRAARTGYLEIMITTYDTYRRDQAKINMIEWDAVIADECQKVKERTSGITEAMNVVNSLCRVGLTGTAIMNHYGELWNLLNWIRPGEVGTYSDWKNDIENPLKIGQAHGSTNAELARARSTANDLVKNLLPRMFLRRMKSLIAHQLPKKTDRVVFCKLGALQQEVYENYLESEIVGLVKYSTDKCDCGSHKTRGKCCYRKLEDGTTVSQAVFPCITNMKLLCNHLANWIPRDGESLEKQEKDIEKLQIGLPGNWEKYYRRQYFENVMDPEFCGKWQVLQRLLAFWKENEEGAKVLIFSESKKLLKMLYMLLNNTHYNICYLDGEMSLEDRTAAVENFNTDPSYFAFLISTRAGGVGLNIVSANKVVVFDPSWNPSHDLQAQDRAYRIGQRRDVEVFRLVCAGTIEEMVYARQIYKQQQANIGYEASFERRYFKGVMKDASRRGELFGLKNLFTFHQENVVLQEIMNQTNVAESKTGIAILNMPDISGDGPDESTVFGEEGRGDEVDDIIGQIQAMVSDDANNPATTGANKKMKLDPVSAILVSAGVEYTHDNTEVIGTSKLEENISRKAVEVNEDPTMRAMTAFQNDVMNDGRFKVGGVPGEVRVRQFNELRRAFGYEKKEEGRFALEVEGWRPEKRAGALEKFYRSRRTVLAARGELTERDEVPEVRQEVITVEDTEEEEEEEDEDGVEDEGVEDEDDEDEELR